MPTASLHTLGCRLNQAETAIIAKSLTEHGYEIVKSNHPADLTIVNTCTVTEQADAKCRQAIRKALRGNPGAFVAVVGCYSQMAVNVIKAIEGVDLIMGNEHKLNVVDYLGDLQKKESPLVIHSRRLPREEFVIDSVGLYEHTTRANLKLQDGCDDYCSFCIIPQARGRARSRRFADVLNEAEKLVAVGHKEIVLTGVNIGTYSSNGQTLLDIVKALEQISGLARIRVSSIEPTSVGSDLVRHLAGSDKLCRHLHIPLQSGDETILKKMRRRHTVGEYIKFIEWAAELVPDIGLGTDLLVGFPGEGDTEFKSGKKVVADLPISYFHVFTYSDRPGTLAAKMPDKIDPQTKKARTRIMIELGQRQQYTFYERHLGRTINVLFENEEKGYWVGFADNYMRVQAKSKESLHNQIRPVRLLRIDGDRITGVLCQ